MVLRNSFMVAFTLASLTACDFIGADENNSPNLIALERSATTLKLQWDAIGTATEYTVDYLTGPAFSTCTFGPMHNDVQHVTGTSVTVTGLTPSTLYQIHVHPLPHGAHTESSTKLILINTLEQNAAAQPIVSADYTTCQ